MQWKYCFFFILITISLSTCRKEFAIDELLFFELSIEEPEILELGKVRLRGDISQPDTEIPFRKLSKAGFIISTDNPEVELENCPACPTLEQNGDFFSNQNLEQIYTTESLLPVYYVRAFARMSLADGTTRTMYSPSLSFSFNGVRTILNIQEPDSVLSNNRARIKAALIGLNNISGQIPEYGIIYDTKLFNQFDPDLPGVSFEATDADQFYEHQFKDLQFNTTYYFKSFYKYQSEYVLSEEVQIVEVKDGWELIASFPGFKLSNAAIWTLDNGEVFIGLGCEDQLCGPNNLNHGIYKIDTSGVLEAQDINFSFFGLQRDYPVSWTYNDKLYFGLGQKPIRNRPTDILSNFYFIEGTSDRDFPTPINAPFPKARIKAFAEVIDSFVYVGGGMDGSTFFNDLYRLNLNSPSSTWDSLGSIPLDNCDRNSMGLQKGYSWLISEVYNGELYIGTGFTNTGVRDRRFLKYTPPSENEPFGSWDLLDCAPLALGGASSFLLKDRIYFGTGNFLNEKEMGLTDYTNHWWVFDPNNNTFERRAPFPGRRLEDALTFTSGEYGFIIGGKELITSDGNTGDRNEFNTEFWRYIPRN